jgi:hypothetical protein
MAQVVYDGVTATYDVYCNDYDCHGHLIGTFDYEADADDYADEHEEWHDE